MSSCPSPVRFLLLPLMLLAAAACGTPVDNTHTTPDAGQEVVDAGPPPTDQCQGTEDLDWLKSTVKDGKTGRELAREEASNCGLGCLSDPAPDACAIRCMTQVKGVQLSDGCAACYGGIVLCTIEKCLPSCIDDPQSDPCKECQDTKGCNEPFYACTGNLD